MSAKTDEFVENFINQCIDDGFSKPTQIVERASERIKVIDEDMKKLIKLQSERNNLNCVLKSFNLEIKAKTNSKKAKALIKQESVIDSETLDGFQNKILALFTDEDDEYSAGEIVKLVTETEEQSHAVYYVLQKLQVDKVLIRENNLFSLVS